MFTYKDGGSNLFGLLFVRDIKIIILFCVFLKILINFVIKKFIS